MRWLVLVLLAPVLLSGCGLLFGPSEMHGVSLGPDRMEICRGPVESPVCVVQSITQLPEDGYALSCQGVDEADCQEVAERVTAGLGPRREARWVVVWPDWQDVCWEESGDTDCDGHAREPGAE